MSLIAKRRSPKSFDLRKQLIQNIRDKVEGSPGLHFDFNKDWEYNKRILQRKKEEERRRELLERIASYKVPTLVKQNKCERGTKGLNLERLAEYCVQSLEEKTGDSDHREEVEKEQPQKKKAGCGCILHTELTKCTCGCPECTWNGYDHDPSKFPVNFITKKMTY